MDHQAFVLVLALVLALVARGMWWLTAHAAGRRAGRPTGPVAHLAALLPAAGFTFVCARMLWDMAGDPTAANLWPLAIGGMLLLWAVWIGVVRTVAGLARHLA